MTDIQITKKGKTKVVVSPLTTKAKGIFASQKFPGGFISPANEAHKLLSWAASHGLSVDSSVLIVIPELPRLTREELGKIFPNIPASFQPRTLFAIGKSKFKGDNFAGELAKLSLNKIFDKGTEYPVYDNEGLFVVGKDGKAYKMTPAAWTDIKQY